MNSFLKAKEAIDKAGFLLVFPIRNADHPNSLWNVFHPNSLLRWEWDTTGDRRVFDLWTLREQLAQSREVVYGKYDQGRATFFSKAVFRDLLTIRLAAKSLPLSYEAKRIRHFLEMDSPLSTKDLKNLSGLKGKFLEPQFHRVMKELWSSLQIVGLGEVDDGAFPSLAHGATQTVFEDLWNEAVSAELADAWMRLCDVPDFEWLLKRLLMGWASDSE